MRSMVEGLARPIQIPLPFRGEGKGEGLRLTRHIAAAGHPLPDHAQVALSPGQG
jgi:hypothetical protein